MIVGVVFLLVGILGFIPGITANYETLQFAGHESEAMLLGLFQVSILHNIVHLLFGIAGIAMAKTGPAASKYLLIGGIIYLILWIYGLIVAEDSAANFVPLNTADDWLHLLLFIAMVALSFLPAGGLFRPDGYRWPAIDRVVSGPPGRTCAAGTLRNLRPGTDDQQSRGKHDAGRD